MTNEEIAPYYPDLPTETPASNPVIAELPIPYPLDYEEWKASGFPMGSHLPPSERAVFVKDWEDYKKRAPEADSAAIKMTEDLHRSHVATMKKLHGGGWRYKGPTKPA
jgi:hypothetical protein